MTLRSPRHRPWRQGVALVASSLALLLAPGCIESQPGPGPGPDDSDLLDWTRTAALTAAPSCDVAEEWLQNSAIAQMDMHLETNRRCFLDTEACGWGRAEVDFGQDGAEPPAAGAPEGDDGASEAPDDFSETNTQVEGVDEADRVKSDGTHLYVLSNRDLVVVKSWPAADTDELGRVSLRTYPHSFFLDGDRAVVLGYGNLYEVAPDAPRPNHGEGDPNVEIPPSAGEGGGASSPGSDGESTDAGAPAGDEAAPPREDWDDERGWYGYRSVATVTIVDLSDRANPTVVKEYFFDGYSVDSRRIDNKVYLAQNNYVYFQGLEYWPDLRSQNVPASEINAAFDAMRARNVARIRAQRLDDWLPRMWTADGGGDVAWDSGVRVGACTDVHVPTVYSGQSLLSLVTLDLDDGGVAASTIQGSWGNVYASLDALYIGSTNYEFFWWWRGADDVPDIKTHIHKFAFDDTGRARYVASGEVVGYALNQFAFDEYQGHLRVATTDGFGWWNSEETESRVTVLRQEGARLAQAGLVTGLGPDERIFSVRFIRDQGYVVTFRDVDPLYVIDLADPTNPVVTGELKIPGFSSYIHPLEDGFLLTAGRDGDDEGNMGGIKIEIFDVRDPTNPFSVTTSVIGDGWNTWSSVLWDHKAFSFFRARNLLAIPVSGWVESRTDEGWWWGEYRSELALFHVTTDSIEPLPSISHMGFFDDFGGNANCRYYHGYWQASIWRGVFADDYVYSLSSLGIQVHDTRAIEDGPVAAMTLLDPAQFQGYHWDRCEDDWGWTGDGEDPDDRDGEQEPHHGEDRDRDQEPHEGDDRDDRPEMP